MIWIIAFLYLYKYNFSKKNINDFTKVSQDEINKLFLCYFLAFNKKSKYNLFLLQFYNIKLLQFFQIFYTFTELNLILYSFIY